MVYSQQFVVRGSKLRQKIHIRNLIVEYTSTSSVSFEAFTPAPSPPLWSCSSGRSLKANCDVAVKKGRAVVACVICDSSGSLVHGFVICAVVACDLMYLCFSASANEVANRMAKGTLSSGPWSVNLGCVPHERLLLCKDTFFFSVFVCPLCRSLVIKKKYDNGLMVMILFLFFLNFVFSIMF